MSLSAVVFKSMLALEREFPGYRFEREPTSGECEAVYPDGARIPWDVIKACEQWLGNISHIGVLRGGLLDISGRHRLWSGSFSIPATTAET